MVEAILHDLHRNASLERERRPAVSERVQVDEGQGSVGVRDVVPLLCTLELATETFGM